MITFRITRIRPILDRSHIIREGVGDNLADIRELTHEFGFFADVHADGILKNEHLCIAIRTSANADRAGFFEGFCDAFCQSTWHTFENDRERTGCFEGECIAADFFSLIIVFSLDAIAGKRVHGLRRQTEMGDDWDSGFYKAFNEGTQRAPPSSFTA